MIDYKYCGCTSCIVLYDTVAYCQSTSSYHRGFSNATYCSSIIFRTIINTVEGTQYSWKADERKVVIVALGIETFAVRSNGWESERATIARAQPTK
jgi:hypothetical protein